ncbi:hypothetical protein AB7M45_007797 [Bradyrhizobium elkanii]|uniref:hypothetical protein n=1 Tax=Bradyrhizobium elkanii TaxID=29448 RepID=UPI00091831F9|nr:hypothetical protein [Bradyrhizobium elkanii]MCW2195024.1 hypothetical protein [Bradyrhizobium elkanii]NWL67281.1 hypothetical protein [Bradyrhizobium elkanii]OIM94672.1 hypothetical protein BLN97_09380 [Bradyrhizobium elkanii]
MTAVTLDEAWAVPGYTPAGDGGQAVEVSPEAILATVEEPEAINKTKTLIRHDATGFITQVILDAERPMEEISAAYTAAGIDHMLYDGPVDIREAYVDVTKEPKEVLPKPEVVITGDIRPIKADGVDALHLTVQPEQFTLYIWYDNKLVHQEDVTDGNIEFAIDQVGQFRVTVVPPQPYKVGAFDVVAQ